MIISSTGSATVHCIETSLVEEPRDAGSLSVPELGFRTARAATSASSCIRGLSGDLGVGTLSLWSPLTMDTKLWLAVMLGLFAAAARKASEVREDDRDPSQTLGRGGTGGIVVCLDVSRSS